MSMTFNEFQRELRAHGIKEKEAYFFTLIYERLGEVEEQLSMCARLMQSLTNTMQNFAQLNAVQQDQLRKFIRSGRPEGVEVESVFPEPEKD